MNKTALIIGLSSQDGSYLADLLLEKGYTVVGTIRRSTNVDRPNIRHLYGRVHVEVADLLDHESIARLVRQVQPDEVYNIAAQSVPADSWGGACAGSGSYSCAASPRLSGLQSGSLW